MTFEVLKFGQANKKNYTNGTRLKDKGFAGCVCQSNIVNPSSF